MKNLLSTNEAIDLICRLEDLCKKRYGTTLDLNIIKELAQEVLEEKIRSDFRESIEALEPADLITLSSAIVDYELEKPDETKKSNKNMLI